MQNKLLKNKDLFYLWAGQMSSIFGNRFSGLAIPWIILTITGSAVQMSIVSLCSQVAPFLFSIPLGAIIEKKNKKKVAILAEVTRLIFTSLIVVFAFRHLLETAILGLVLFILGLATVNFRIAFNAMLPTVAGRSNLVKAHNYLEGADAISTLLGPTLAGLIFARYGSGITLMVDAVAILISLLSVIMIKKMDFPIDSSSNHKSWRQMLNSSIDGLTYIFKNKQQMILLVISFSLNLITIFIPLVTIIHAKSFLHISIAKTGLLLAGAGIGNIIGVIIMGKLKNVRWLSSLAIVILVSSLSVFIFFLTTNYWAIFICIMCFDGALSMGFVFMGSTKQAITPDEYLSRVGSVGYVVNGVATILGTVLSGLLSQAIGSSYALFIGSIIMFITVLFLIIHRSYDKPFDELKPIMLEG